MTITQWADYETLPHYLRDEEDPYSLPIIIRIEKNSEDPYLEVDAFKATAAALLSMFDEAKWGEEISAWMNGRIRKVVRRARAAAWIKILELDHYYAKVGNVEVVILKPHRVEELPAEVRKLQVQGIELVKSNIENPSGLSVAMNPEVPMSSGKAMAQVGHAIQVSMLNSSVEQLEAWKSEGFPVSIVRWEEISSTATTEIRDAGFTEIPSGSLTCVAAFV